VLQLGSLVGLYLSVSFLLVLLFGLINLLYPDAAEGYYAAESAASQVRIGIAMVVVFFPTYLILTRIVNKLRRKDGQGAYLGLTKWLIYLSLLVGGIAILVDLVVVINTFLEGEITQRFILKAFAVLAIVGAAVHYYILDAKGFWLKREDMSIYYGIGVGIVAFVAVAYGFAYIETPAEVREGRIDEQQLVDLQNIQYQIESYYTLNNALPETLVDLPKGIDLPQASEGREPYTYERTENGFALCATFAQASTGDQYSYLMPMDETMVIKNRDNWTHGEGRYCFERVVK
jgi:hypothetical protein